MNKQEEMWAGKFGDEYTERNSSFSLYLRRKPFWREFVKKYKIPRVLEVGCNRGHNLQCFEGMRYGIDVNERALKKAQELWKYNGTWCEYGKATDIPFKDNFFDLVFTCGLLIHIPPDDLLPVMSEMVRCSHKYVMFMEYWAEKEEEIEYRGEMGLLWKRPYKDIFLSFYSRHSQYECIDEGFLTKDDGFDDVTWWLFERK